jgi:2-phospho-L-lactate/phosphoenolpyruvate guanylyltransferase
MSQGAGERGSGGAGERESFHFPLSFELRAAEQMTNRKWKPSRSPALPLSRSIMMRYILIPVKDLSLAKQRLAGLMAQEERIRLAWTLLETTLAAASRVKTADRIAVVTIYPPAIALAEKYGMEVFIETDQISESISVDLGSREAKRRGASAVLRLPIDLPLIMTTDIEKILEYDTSGELVVLVPSRHGTGTNAILRRPPDLFPSHFGPGSLAKHLTEAERTKANCKIVEMPRIALDIDDPEDVVMLLKIGGSSPAYDLLLEMKIDERIRPISGPG